jgi:4'-phosphopantetheinyl transferase
MIALWKMPQSKLALAEKHIHVWKADLDLPIIGFKELYQTLSIDERARARRFRFEKDRKRFIARHGILRVILGCYLSVEPYRLRFWHGKNGKPALAHIFGKEAILFNTSDSYELALYAFTPGHEVGVDIERIRDFPEMDQIAERFFSEREKGVFRAIPENRRKEAFFRCWTRKEAFLKAIGDGLSRPLDAFDVSMAGCGRAGFLRMKGDSNGVPQWSIQELSPAPGFVAALATEGQGWQVDCWHWQEC